MKKWLSIFLTILLISMSATVCLSDEGSDEEKIPNLTQEQTAYPIESGSAIVNLNEDPNGKKITNVEQVVVEATTVRTNTQGQAGN